MTQSINTLTLVRRYWQMFLKSGDFCIDATAGRGRDTVALARLVGESGRVLAMDIQARAVKETRARLAEEGLNADVILADHAEMAHFAQVESVDGIVFNLGYLPGGDHALATKAKSTIKAIQGALSLLKPGGIVTICIYHGGDSGFEERDEVLSYLKALDHKQYTVIVSDFFNRPNHPPLAVLIVKEKFEKISQC